MVIYDLECAFGHVFEGWFRDSDVFARQLRDGQIHCSHCGVSHVQRLPSGFHIGSGGQHPGAAVQPQVEKSAVTDTQNLAPQSAATLPTLDPVTMMKAIHHFVNENFRDVGRAFADEAIRMHRGELSREPIRGRANAADQERLQDEGVACMLLPELPDAIKN